MAGSRFRRLEVRCRGHCAFSSVHSSRSSSPGRNDSGRSWPFHLSISVGTTQDRLGHLFDAARRFSEAHAGETPLGLISYRHAQTLVGQAWSIPTEGLSAFEVALLPAAQTLTVAKLKQKAQVLRERLHPETSATRRARSILDRTSWVQAEPDGMATLHLTTGVGQGVRATVQVTVSVLTLLGHSEEPVTSRLMGRFPPRRPETWRFAGCKKSAHGADLDHTHDWHLLGQTAVDNLTHLCKANHDLKSETRGTVASRRAAFSPGSRRRGGTSSPNRRTCSPPDLPPRTCPRSERSLGCSRC